MDAPPAAVDAVIFDLDGTLVDNMRFHLEAWVAFGRRRGVELTVERVLTEFAGMTNPEILPRVLGRSLSHDELKALADEKEGAYRALYAPYLRPVPGLGELLDRLARAGKQLAVASAAPAENRRFVLEGLSLSNRFSQVVGPEEKVRGKPHPDLFLLAANRLGRPPARCLVFEDAVNGVEAARAAGMPVAALCTTAAPAALTGAGARWVLPDYRTLPDSLTAALGV